MGIAPQRLRLAASAPPLATPTNPIHQREFELT
jgi:hypothetical protein